MRSHAEKEPCYVCDSDAVTIDCWSELCNMYCTKTKASIKINIFVFYTDVIDN